MVVVVFSSQVLMDTDKPILNAVRYEMAKNSKQSEPVSLICVLGIEAGLKLCTSGRVLLVLDEADYSLLDVPSDF